jgi:dihydroxyacid dehydratase/phosphogluconate dehydratase
VLRILVLRILSGAGGQKAVMDAKTNSKSRLPSRHVAEGPERAPHRSYLHAMGPTAAQIRQPFVGVASCRDEAAPCKALENAATTVVASGGSTKAALHHPAIAHECNIEFTLFDVAEVFKRTPYIADLKPGGRYVAKDMVEVGGIPLLMKTQLDHGYLHGECMAVTGRTIAENLKSVTWNPDQDVVFPADKPITVTGGIVGLKGNLAPEGAIEKVAGMKTLKFTVTHPGGAAGKQSYVDA